MRIVDLFSLDHVRSRCFFTEHPIIIFGVHYGVGEAEGHAQVAISYLLEYSHLQRKLIESYKFYYETRSADGLNSRAVDKAIEH